MAQRKFDWTVRGDRLRMLEKVRLPLAASRMSVLRAIDDCIGKDPAWTIPISRLATSTNLSRATVSRSIGDLARLGVIDVEDNFRKKSGGVGVQRLPSRFRVIWSNLVDFVPGQSDAELAADPELMTVRRGFQAEESGGVLQCEPGVLQCEPGGVAVWGEGSTHSEAHYSRPVTRPTPVPSPPTEPGNGEGTGVVSGGGVRLLWREVVAAPERLREAVRKRDGVFLTELWREAVAAGWTRNTRDLMRRFLAACFYVCHPPPGFPIRNPAAVLRSKLIDDQWKTGRMDGQDDDWAAALLRKIEGTASRPRTSNLAEVDDSGHRRDVMLLQLAAIRKQERRPRTRTEQ